MGTRTFFLHSDVFKIVLKDASPELRGVTGGTSPPTNSGSGRLEYFIHKTLLTSLSTELHKHVNNDMREGRENLIELSEVDEPTLEAFLEWAYFKDYQVASLLPKSSAALLYHTKIYVLADRFNIPLLKDLAFSKITILLTELGMVAERADLMAMVVAVTYAYNNLLAYSGGPGGSNPTPERLLRYFTQYISWALDVFRPNDEFTELLASNSDFAEALIVGCRPALTPPWTAGKGSETTSTDSNDILYRKCSCGYTGVMGIQCAACTMFDEQINTGDGLHGPLLGTFGVSRVSGAQKNFQYTCKWCQASETYNTSTRVFHTTRGNYYAQSCLGCLWCPKCHSRGYNTDSGIISFV